MALNSKIPVKNNRSFHKRSADGPVELATGPSVFKTAYPSILNLMLRFCILFLNRNHNNLETDSTYHMSVFMYPALEMGLRSAKKEK